MLQCVGSLKGDMNCKRKVCCSVLQCVAVCCSVLQCIAVCWLSNGRHGSYDKGVLQCVAVVLQCIAVRRGALQCVGSLKGDMNLETKVCCSGVAVCCSVLQCVAVCCSALQARACCSVLQWSVLQCVAVPRKH